MKVGVLEFELYKKQVRFYTNEGVQEFPDFLTFVEAKIQAKVYIKSNLVGVLWQHVSEERKNITLSKITSPYFVGFSVYTNKALRYKTFRSLKYHIGSDDFEPAAALERVNKLPDVLSSYNGRTKKLLNLKEKHLDFLEDFHCSLSPFMYVKTIVEYKNVKCFDLTSAYIYQLMGDLPHYSRRIDSQEMDFNDKRYAYYGGIKIKNIRAKNSFYSLSLVGNGSGSIMKGQGIGIVRRGTRLIEAEEVVLFGWLSFLLEELKDYDYESYEITTYVYRFILRPDENIRRVLVPFYKAKEQKSELGLDNSNEKLLLNRVYGTLLSRTNNRNYMPSHYGTYIVQKQKATMNRVAHEIGEKDLIHGHTDSLKFVGDHEDVIERYNAAIEYDKLGKFKNEGTMEKVVYYNVNKAKYIKDGKLEFKHGGITDDDLIPMYMKSYEDINFSTTYLLTLYYYYDKELGLVPYKLPTAFGGNADKNMEE